MAENEVMEKAGDILGKKYGPLPFGAWLVIIAVTAYGVRRVLKGRSEAAEAEAVATDEGYVIDENGNMLPSAYKGAGGGLPFGSGVNTGAGSTGNTPATAPTEINNEPWMRRAVEKLKNAGMWDPVTVQTALLTYISGGALDQRQKGIVNQAILVEGLPPINVDAGQVQGDPVSGQTPAPIYMTRLVKNAGNGGWWAEYSDGSKRTVKNVAELTALRAGNPGIATATLLSNDPFWSSQLPTNTAPINLNAALPAGKTVKRLVKNLDTGGWWMVYNDDSTRTVANPQELNAIIGALPNVSKISLPGSDPFWKSRANAYPS